MSQQLSDDAIAVLQHLDYDGLLIRFSQVAPTLYSEVNEVLTRLGGKWKGGRTKAHVFQEDPTHLIEYVLTTALMPPKNPDAFFPTPNEVARGIMMMSELDKLSDDDLFLEPQAGYGALPDYLQQHASELLYSNDFAPQNHEFTSSRNHPFVAPYYALKATPISTKEISFSIRPICVLPES